MTWQADIFRYCERGENTAFWAEPLNALSNLAFFIAAVWFGRQTPQPAKADQRALVALAGLAGCVGLGSAAMHTFATGWSQVADVGSIGGFMLAALAVVVRRGLLLSPLATGLVCVTYLGAMAVAAVVSEVMGCRPPVAAFVMLRGLSVRCANGGLAYVPALVALLLCGALLAKRHGCAARWLIAAAILFGLGFTARTMDVFVCPLASFGTVRLTGHALWHLAMASVVACLLACIRTLMKPLPGSSAAAAT